MTSPRDKALQEALDNCKKAADYFEPHPDSGVDSRSYPDGCIYLHYAIVTLENQVAALADSLPGLEALKREMEGISYSITSDGEMLEKIQDGIHSTIDHLASKGLLSTGEWLPIETAPKLGRILLAAKNPPFGYQVAYGHWWKTYNRWEYDGYAFGNPTEQPDYWRPLPEPPIAAVKKP